MSVYFKFKSTKEFNSLPIVGQFISIGNLKKRIFELKHLGRGTDIDLIISNAQTNEEYTDEDVLIPRNTSVLIRRVPGRPRMRVVANFKENCQNDGPRGRGRMMRGRGFGIGIGIGIGCGLFENRNPPLGYVCHRCNIIGHFIQHCSTNGNPAYDPKRFKPPTGIPKSMLMTTPDGSYTLPGGAVAVLQPDEAAFEKAIEGIPTLARAAISISTKRTERSDRPDDLPPPSKKQKG